MSPNKHTKNGEEEEGKIVNPTELQTKWKMEKEEQSANIMVCSMNASLNLLSVCTMHINVFKINIVVMSGVYNPFGCVT